MPTKRLFSKTGLQMLGLWIAFLSFFDAWATDIGIRMYDITEANPFVAWLYDMDRTIFYAYKIVLPLSLLAVIPYIIDRLSIIRLLVFAAAVYTLLALYHVGWMMWVASLSVS